MRASKVVDRRKAPQTPAEFHALGARLDRELSVVRPFTRKRGFISKRVLGMNSQSGNRSDLSRIMPGGIDLQTLIKSKSTEREQDKVDVQRLRSLSRSE
jgi:hypothetical protein